MRAGSKESNLELSTEEPTSYMTRLQVYMDIDLVPEEYRGEFIYSKFLDDVIGLTKSIMGEKGHWRVQEQYIMKLGYVIEYFNALEINDMMGHKMMELLRKSCDSVKNSAAWFVANLIANMYCKNTQKELINQIINEYGTSESFVKRKSFIMFCA